MVDAKAESFLNGKKRSRGIGSHRYSVKSKNTGKSIKQIENDTDRDNYLTADDAKNYGLVDKILTTTP